MGRRQRQTPAGTPGPPWAGLQVDLWRQVALAASEACLESGWSLPWAEGMALLSTMSMVCRSMHEAVTGLGADALWQRPCFVACHAGLSQQRSQGLNRLQARRCQSLSSISMLSMQCGGWPHEELQEVLSALPRTMGSACFQDLHNAREAEIIGDLLAGAEVQGMIVGGSTPLAFPATAQHVTMFAEFEGLHAPDAAHQAQSRQLFEQLLHLAHLKALVFDSISLVLTSQDVELLRQLPNLQSLKLALHSWPVGEASSSQQAIGSLSLLQGVELKLTLWPWRRQPCLLHLLQQVQGLCLKELCIIFAGDTAELQPVHEVLLAAGCSCERLRLYFADPARRLRVCPAGVQVVYEQFPELE